MSTLLKQIGQIAVLALFGAVVGYGANAVFASDDEHVAPHQTPGVTPIGWYESGTDAGGYDFGTDPAGGLDGGPAGFIEATDPNSSGFGTLMQTIRADEYVGLRVRLRGLIRTEAAERGTGLWLRIDAEARAVAFDNTEDRRLFGDNDWTEQVIVVDVPRSATRIHFGLLHLGHGKSWMDDLHFEVVGDDVPVTDTMAGALRPQNLNFDG